MRGLLRRSLVFLPRVRGLVPLGSWVSTDRIHIGSNKFTEVRIIAMAHDYGTHEILDRASIAAEFFHANVLEHERLADFPHLKAMAEGLASSLADFYQACGNAFPAEGARIGSPRLCRD